MHHIAIMKKSRRLIPKILSGEKTIESRWYKARFAPWDRIKAGDTVYFKDSGEPVTAKAKVEKVVQYNELDEDTFDEVIENYADQIGLKTREYTDYYRSKNYCILIFLENPQQLEEPFQIDKTGYGNATAWMVMDDIEEVKLL
jgi:predicted transcriptional regulator